MAHLSVKHFSPLRKSFSPSLRHWRHFASRFRAMGFLDSAPLRRAAAVVGGRRHVGDAAELEADAIERAHCRLAAGAAALDADPEGLDAARRARTLATLRLG